MSEVMAISVEEVLKKPSLLDALDLKSYAEELARIGKYNMKLLLHQIFKELRNPFGEVRQYRRDNKTHISNEDLFYMLIDESRKTFMRGHIVTATVIKVLPDKAICRLENGLEAIV